VARRAREPLQPQQARSRFLADAVLEAAERVIHDVGWARAKVSRIASVAGVSVGSLYRYFPGRDVLLSAIIDRKLDADHEAFLAALQQAHGKTVEDTLAAFADAFLQDTRATSPRLLRQLVDVLDRAGRLAAVQQRFDTMIEQFARHMHEHHPELGALPDVHRRCHIGFWGARGALIARVRVEDPFDLEAFRADTLRMMTAVLRPAPSPTIR
jgi:AcrR family transcriptional regulator